MRLVIDRFEENYAILVDEDENVYNLPRELFKDNKENDVIDIITNHEDTTNREKNIKGLMDKLFD